MPLFEFDQVYCRDVPEDELIMEALFFSKKEQTILVFRFFDLFLVNKGPSLHINTFREFNLPASPFHLLEVSRSYKTECVYMILQEGVIKIFSGFSTHHGHPAQFMSFASAGDVYTAWMAEAKAAERFGVIDFRFL